MEQSAFYNVLLIAGAGKMVRSIAEPVIERREKIGKNKRHIFTLETMFLRF